MGTSYCVIVKRSGVESMQNECNQLFVLKDENIFKMQYPVWTLRPFGLVTDDNIIFRSFFFL